MRIAFVGRVGSGKTTCAAAFSRYLAAQDLPVLAIDAGANRRLGIALGLHAPPPSAPAWLDERPHGRSAVGGPVRRSARIVDLDPAGDLLVRHAAAASDGVRLLATDAVGPL